MMNFPLTLAAVVRRAETMFGDRPIVSELPDHSEVRTTYASVIERGKRLAVALRRLGVETGDRVATLCWNHHRHLECYLGITAGGLVLHTLNLRLHPSELTYIVDHADDRVIIVDEVLLPLFNQFRDRIRCKRIIVMAGKEKVVAPDLDYEELLAKSPAAEFTYPDLNEEQPAALCYTSGTTGQPKGVLYSHRGLTLHSLVFGMADVAGISEADTVFPMVPMFHANCWGLPFVGALVGARLLLAGPHFDIPRILQRLHDQRATVAAGVPTIWIGVLQHLEKDPKKYDLSRLRKILVGGSAVPRSLIDNFQKRHGLEIVQLWGMTEMSPLGTMCRVPSTMSTASPEAQSAYRARQGTPLPFVELRARGAAGLVPWDGQSVGELEVRGPWVTHEYYHSPEGAKSFTEDGWFRTGDIVAIDATGCIQVQDRAKDLIKSGGEWISSVAIENALMGHPAVAEAAVVAVAHAKWQERPLAVVVLKEGRTATEAELIASLEDQFAKWWLPDAVVFVDAIPRTSAGKFLKKALRDRYQDYLATPQGS